MKKQEKNMVIGLALAGGAYYLWRQKQAEALAGFYGAPGSGKRRGSIMPQLSSSSSAVPMAPPSGVVTASGSGTLFAPTSSTSSTSSTSPAFTVDTSLLERMTPVTSGQVSLFDSPVISSTTTSTTQTPVQTQWAVDPLTSGAFSFGPGQGGRGKVTLDSYYHISRRTRGLPLISVRGFRNIVTHLMGSQDRDRRRGPVETRILVLNQAAGAASKAGHKPAAKELRKRANRALSKLRGIARKEGFDVDTARLGFGIGGGGDYGALLDFSASKSNLPLAIGGAVLGYFGWKHLYKKEKGRTKELAPLLGALVGFWSLPRLAERF